MDIYVNEKIRVSELGEQELRDISGIEEDTTLYEIIRAIQAEGETPDLASLTAKVDKIMNESHLGYRYFGIFSGKEYVGYASLADSHSSAPDLGIDLREEWQGQGIGYSVLSALIARIFSEREDIDHLSYRARLDNEASIRLVKKLGGTLIETGDFLEQLIKTYHIYR